MKKISLVLKNFQRHWVGDGFPVQSIFSYNDLGRHVSPFLLMDYAGPHDFAPAAERRGVGEHPHRGFETVTIIYDGEVEHRDSHGGGGSIGPGDVQWMTAASGVVHEEMHSERFTKNGGRFELIQLWVNLPAKDKMTEPRYQDLRDNQIPKHIFKDGAGEIRIIAGEFEGTQGPAKTFTPLNLWDARLKGGHKHSFNFIEKHTLLIFILQGGIIAPGRHLLTDNTLAIFEPEGTRLDLEIQQDTKMLILSGEPINEPIVGRGPFVMNTAQEIQQAFVDFSMGRMGHLPV